MKKIRKLSLLVISAICLSIMIFAVSVSTYAATSMSKVKVSAISAQAYTGKAIKPAVTVKYGTKTLVKGTNYTVTYSSNTNPGYATVTVKGKGSYTGTKSVKFQIVSPAVKNLAYSKSTKTSAVVSWSASKKATGYQVYKYTSGSYKLVSSVRTTSATLSGLKVGSTYKVKVRPYNKLASGEVITGAFCTPINVLTLPADIGTISQTAVGNSTATVSWSKVTGASGYTVYSVATDGTKKAIKSVTAASYKLTGLTGSKTVKVAAYRNINGAKKYSADSAALTVNVIPSGKVRNVTVSGIAPTSATLKWTALSGCTYYAIYKSTDGVNYTRLATASKTSYKATGLLPCTEFFFKVCPAVKCSGEWYDSTVTSDVLSFRTIPEAMTGLTAKSVTNKSFTLSWTKCTAVTGYEIYMNGELYKSVASASLKLSGLNESTAYSFFGKAYFENEDGSRLYGDMSEMLEVTTDDTSVDSISISSSAVTLFEGGTDTATLTAQILPSYALNKGVIWTSSNDEVVTVSDTGVVTATGLGTAVITAASAENNAIKASCTVNVCKPVESIDLEKTAVTIAVNEKTALGYEVLPFEASDKGVTFTSSSTTVASVSATGLITGKAVGTAKITVASKENPAVKKVCTVTVKKVAVTGITVPAEITVCEGQTYTFLPEFSPANATNKNFTVSLMTKKVKVSANDGLASTEYTYTVANYLKASSTGTGVTGVKSTSVKPASFTQRATLITHTYSPAAPEYFTAVITSADGSKTAMCSVKVIPASEKVSVTGVSVFSYCSTWYPGKTGMMTASVTPSDATDSSVKWSSSNTDIAYVDAYGNVTAVSPGTVTIKATTVDGKKTATRKITVLERVTPRDITISRTEVRDLVVGDKTQLSAACVPSNANEPYITWTSSNPAVANYYLGNIYGYNEGTAKITATTSNGISKSCVVNVHKEGVVISPSTYFEGLEVGSSTQLTAEAYCMGFGKCDVNWASDNEEVATVSSDGLVTIVGEGKAKITAYSVQNPDISSSAGFTTGIYEAPNTLDKAAFLNTFRNSLNAVKTEDYPEFAMKKSALVDSLEITRFDMDGLIGLAADVIPLSEINDMFSDTLGSELISEEMPMSHPTTEEAKTTYRSTLPLRGYKFAVADNLTASEIKSCETTDLGATQTLTITLNDESISSLPVRTGEIATSHGKLFDIYYKDQVEALTGQLSGTGAGVTLSYTNIASKYSGCFATIKIDKYSGKVLSVVYDMGTVLSVSNCKITIDMKKLTNSGKSGILGDSLKITADLDLTLSTATSINFTY